MVSMIRVIAGRNNEVNESIAQGPHTDREILISTTNTEMLNFDWFGWAMNRPIFIGPHE